MADETTAVQDNNETATNAPVNDGLPQDPITVQAEQLAAEEAKEQSEEQNGMMSTNSESVGDASKEEKTESAEKHKTYNETEDPSGYKDFTLPQGFVQDDEAIAQFKGIAKQSNLSQEQAQQMVNLYADLQAKQQAQYTRGVMELNAKWADELKSDRDIGGAKLKTAKERVNAALRKYGSDQFIAEIGQFNLGNWPSLFKFIHKMSLVADREDVMPRVNRGGSMKNSLAAMFPGIE